MSPGHSRLIVQPGPGLDPVLEAMRRAKRRIDLAIFRLTIPDVEQELSAAVGRGVKVRALVAHRAKGEKTRLREVEQRLLASGVTVGRTGDDLAKYHGKYLVVDDTLHVLGFNFKNKDLESRSFGIQTRSRGAIQEASRLFEADLARQPYEPGGASPLVVSPETSRTCLERFISGARTELAIYDKHVTDTGFVALILQRAAAGVRVRIIGDAPKLASAVPVRMLKGLRLHVRAMVRDSTHVFVGSQGLRPLELDRRRETGLVVRNPPVARHMLDVFESDWEAAASQKTESREERLEFTQPA